MKNQTIGYGIMDFTIQFMVASVAISIITSIIVVIGIIVFPFFASIIIGWIIWNVFAPEKKAQTFDIRQY